MSGVQLPWRERAMRKSGREVVAVRFLVTGNQSGAAVMQADPRHKHLAEAISKLGVSGPQIRKLLTMYGSKDADRLLFALRETQQVMKKGKIKNTAAWFVAAVKRDDRKQGQLFTAEAKQREKVEIEHEKKLRQRPAGPDRGMQPVSALIGGDLGQALERLGLNIKAKSGPGE